MIVEKMIKYLNNILKLKFEDSVLEDKNDSDEDDLKLDLELAFELNESIDGLIDESNGWEINLDDVKLDDRDEHENICLTDEDDLRDEFKHDLNEFVS